MILYSPCPSHPLSDNNASIDNSAFALRDHPNPNPNPNTNSNTNTNPNLTLGDQPFMAVARPSDLGDAELRRWTKVSRGRVRVRA